MRQAEISKMTTTIKQTSEWALDRAEIEKQMSEAPRPIEGRHSKIAEFYNDRSVLITGASGFVGKVLIEKLLRACPRIKRIFVLIRPKWNKQPGERFKELLGASLFDIVRKTHNLEERIVLVEGDVTLPHLGMSEQNLVQVCKEVSVLFHSAATVRFDEPLKHSVNINISGTYNMINLARRLKNLAAFVHVSTAYANCDQQEIDDHVYNVDFDPAHLMQMASWLDQETMQELKARLLKAKPNTYTYTKALAEWLLGKMAHDLPVAVCRPSIVVSTHNEPIRGWIDNFNGPTGIVLGTGKGLIRTIYGYESCVADLIPVDTVINLVISLGWFANVYGTYKRRCEDSNLAESLSGISWSSDRSSLCEDCDATDQDDSGVDIAPGSIQIQNQHDHLNHQHHNHVQNHHVEQQQTRQTNFHTNLSENSLDDRYESRSMNQSSSSVSSMMRCSGRNRFKSCQASFETKSEDGTASPKQHTELDLKLKQFRQNVKNKLMDKDLPEHLADVPVFHCTSGGENPITWAYFKFLMLLYFSLNPPSVMYRYPGATFTTSERYSRLNRLVFHYLPGYIMDFIVRVFGGKAILVRIFEKYDHLSNVLAAFTMNQWIFSDENRLSLMNDFMSDEDRRLFNCDVVSLDWHRFSLDYILGIRRYLLNDTLESLPRCRKKIQIVRAIEWLAIPLFSLWFAYYMLT